MQALQLAELSDLSVRLSGCRLAGAMVRALPGRDPAQKPGYQRRGLPWRIGPSITAKVVLSPLSVASNCGSAFPKRSTAPVSEWGLRASRPHRIDRARQLPSSVTPSGGKSLACPPSSWGEGPQRTAGSAGASRRRTTASLASHGPDAGVRNGQCMGGGNALAYAAWERTRRAGVQLPAPG